MKNIIKLYNLFVSKEDSFENSLCILCVLKNITFIFYTIS